MEQDLTTLAAAAATTLVQTMTTDAWQQAKARVAALWRHARSSQDEDVETELDAARLEMLAALEANDEQTGLDLADEWAARLQQLVSDDSRRLADLLELAKMSPPRHGSTEATPVTSIKMRAKASGRAQVFQAGRDQEITER